MTELMIYFYNLYVGESAEEIWPDFPSEDDVAIEPSDRFSEIGDVQVYARIEASEIGYMTFFDGGDFDMGHLELQA